MNLALCLPPSLTFKKLKSTKLTVLAHVPTNNKKKVQMCHSQSGWMKISPKRISNISPRSPRQTLFFSSPSACRKRKREREKTSAADSLHKNTAASVIEYKRLSPDRSGSKPGIAPRAHPPLSNPPSPPVFFP